MTLYRQNGADYFAASEENLIIHQTLPAGIYTINFSPFTGFFLSKSDEFNLVDKIYGDVSKRAERILTTFKDRPNSTGVILAGEKGSGKTMLTKMLANKMVDHNMVAIIVTQKYHGQDFNEFIYSIEQPAMIMFDEYEKVYDDNESQSDLLTLFDGIYSSKKLFVITCNKRHLLSEYMINRPGRFYYDFNYRGLDESFIREYLADVLNDKNLVDVTTTYIAAGYSPVNFDMLKAIAEEMNRYNEDAPTVISYLNISENTRRERYVIVDIKLKKNIEGLVDISKKVNGGADFNPFTQKFFITANTKRKYPDDDSVYDDEHYMYYDVNDLVKIDANTMSFENDDAFIRIQRAPEKSIDFSQYLG